MSIESASASSPVYPSPAEPVVAPADAEEFVQLPATATTRRWTRADTLIVLAAMLCAWLFYLVRLDRPSQYIYDEVYHGYTAARLVEGNPDPYNPLAKVPEADRRYFKVWYVWDHPALAKLPMEVGIKMFGDNPFGWRIASTVFGALGLGVVYGLGRVMFDRTVALLTTALLLLDGMWFVQSRTSMNDIFLVFFLMLGYLAFYLYLTQPHDARWRYLVLTGVGLGLALATKWSAVYSVGLVGLVATIREATLSLRNLRSAPRRAVLLSSGAIGTLALTFVVLPLGLYIGAYVQYFMMGYTWSDWQDLQRRMWEYHSTLKACHDWASPWWTWPLLLKPVWYYGPYEAFGNQANIFNVGNPTSVVASAARLYPRPANVFTMGNPLSWWLYLPAVIGVGIAWVRGRFQSVSLGLILLGFLGQWLPWAFSPRISYLYHFLPCVPFGCLALAYWLGKLRERRRLLGTYFVVVLLSFAFFYPLYTGIPSSREPVLRLSRVSPALQDVTFTEMHYWLPSWRPGRDWAFNQSWPFRCPMPENNPVHWVSRLIGR